MSMKTSKLLKYGCVCFIPIANRDLVQASMVWQGQTILELEPSEVLPGYLGWFTLAGMPQPQIEQTDPGLEVSDNL